MGAGSRRNNAIGLKPLVKSAYLQRRCWLASHPSQLLPICTLEAKTPATSHAGYRIRRSRVGYLPSDDANNNRVTTARTP
jgi:hypothetical protein